MYSLYVRLIMGRMSGDRASTVRMRETGKICCSCDRLLSPPFHGRQRVCPQCEVDSMGLKRTVLMQFKRNQGWQINFSDSTNPSAQFRELIFAHSSKIQDLVRKSGTQMMSEDVNALEYGIRQGAGAVPLRLSNEQYKKLLR
jgi:hypothetical protein